MNLKEIKEMINLMNENNLAELEIEHDGLRIKLKKTASGTEVFSEGVPGKGQRVLKNTIDELSQLKAQEEEKITTKTVEIKAPMVGTFYRAPSPEAPPYIEIGQLVEIGQVICIIEAMKLMNEIKCEIKGKILEILVDNAEPVEYGQPILLIEPL